MKRVFTFYPQRWAAFARIVIYGSAEFGFGLNAAQMAVIFAGVESLLLILGESWVTSNERLDPETVRAAKQGTPGPGVAPYSAQQLLDQQQPVISPPRLDPSMGAAGSSAAGHALPSSAFLSVQASRELDRMMAELIPPGHTGAAVTIIDLEGARLGVAVKHGESFSASLEVHQPWENVKPNIKLQVRATW